MRMILARLTIFCGVFPSAISCCSCSRAFRSSTNRDSSCSIREMNHDHTRDSNVRDRTLAGTDNVWKSIVFGRFNLRTEKHEVRAFGRDHGNHYFMNIDDPETFGIRDPNSLSQREREVLDGMIERIENENVLFEIAVTCFQLPAYFAFRITLVRETKRDTVIAALSAVQSRRWSSSISEDCPPFAPIRHLNTRSRSTVSGEN